MFESRYSRFNYEVDALAVRYFGGGWPQYRPDGIRNAKVRRSIPASDECDTGKETARFDHITWHRNIAHRT